MNRAIAQTALLTVLLATTSARAGDDAPDGPAEKAAPAPGPATYRLVPEKSELVVRTFKDGLAAKLAHDHVVKAGAFDGEVFFDPEHPENSRVKIVVDATRLIVDNTAMRHRYGVPGFVSEGDLEKIRAAMVSEEQLWVEKHKTIEFVSTKVKRNEDLTYTVTGDFTLRGVTRPVKMTVMIDTFGDGLRGIGKVRLKQSDFGYEPYEAFLGAVKVKDEIVLHVNLIARKKS